MSPIKIVFTGGPCAGKTTLITMTKKYLEEKGYKVIYVSETATDLIEAGIDFNYVNSLVNFQTIILKYQSFKENMSELIGKNSDNTIILYDRALLDNKAYFDNYRDFDYIMKNIDESEISILDKYDYVFDLLSLATCDVDRYSLSSNKARTEDPKTAKALDLKTSNVWVGHRNLYLFNSNMTLDSEFGLIRRKLDDILSGRNSKVVEHFEIDNTISDFSNYNDNNSRLISVEKIYFPYFELYKRTYKGSTSYVLGTDLKSTQISFEEYLEAINRYQIYGVEKYKSLNFVRDKQLFEVKFYDDKTILEYEENKFNREIILPPEINCNVKKKVLR